MIAKCKHCKSEDVVLDAWAYWNTDNGSWELDKVFDYSFCRDCDGETTIIYEEE